MTALRARLGWTRRLAEQLHVVLLGPVPPPQGGVQTHLMALADYLRREGHRVSVINITRHKQPDGRGYYFPKSAAGLLARVISLRPSILHVHLGGHLSRRDLGLCLALAAVPGSKVVLTLHSGGYPRSEAGRKATPRSLAGYVLRRLAGLIAVNPEIEAVFHRLGVSPAHTTTIEPHCIDPLELSVEPEAMPEALREFAGQHDPFLLTVGLLEPEYSLELQIDTLPLVRARHPGAGLAIIGSGSLEARLRSRIQGSPVREHLLLCGDVPHRGTLAAIRRAAVLLRPTQFDGDSVSVREALAMGTRVLASDTGMRPHGVRLLRSLEPASLAEGISGVLHEPHPPQESDRGESNLEQVLRFYLAALRPTVPHHSGAPA